MKNLANAASTSNAHTTGKKSSRRSGDAGGTVATLTFIALLAVAAGLLGYMVAIR
ncbi:hypothetical protein [Streptomyces sp. MUM 178J]|uniref:hypothetical protein n=1 Tax=Streptomyces sp. MUM 178J TaxID=2791991 RepID=UPI001F04D705|nr:hypothetical protein [Streptomyces sp. MUM 178J]WRQ83038.1 hypothetical protein I3F59_028860 [Streptomyces sp. MUM 178J]